MIYARCANCGKSFEVLLDGAKGETERGDTLLQFSFRPHP